MDQHGRMRSSQYRQVAMAAAHDPPVGPLNQLVDELRVEGGLFVPYVAPTYGGVNAEVLLLFQDPGPMTNPTQANGSGFLSAENDDPAARRLAWLLDVVELPQSRCVSWNANPWYRHGQDEKVDVRRGIEPLRRFLELCPKLRVIALCGNPAHYAWDLFAASYRVTANGYATVRTRHTGNRAFIVRRESGTTREHLTLTQLYDFAEIVRLADDA